MVILLQGGDLFDAITSTNKYTERDASGMLYNLASAIKYLHSLNIVHRDIKPENLLVSENSAFGIVDNLGVCERRSALLSPSTHPPQVYLSLLSHWSFSFNLSIVKALLRITAITRSTVTSAGMSRLFPRIQRQSCSSDH